MTEHIKSGVDFTYLNAEKFKTNTISVFFNIPLKKETVTYAALLPAVMKRGTKKHKTMNEISVYLDELYSATLHAGIRVKGDGETLYFTIEYIRDEFIGESLTGKIIELLKEFVFEPLTGDSGFNEDYLKGEKQNLKNAIEGLINDKREYVEFKCREAMFGGEGYGMFEAGRVEDLPGITGSSLYDFYSGVISGAKVDVFAGGSFSDSALDEIRSELCEAFTERRAEYVETEIAAAAGETRNITEEIPVVQSKLCIGLRCGIEPTSKMYYALILGSCVFGGSPFSKLFNNVREKLSLAYYATSRVERFKSTMFISCGIETDKYSAALGEIMAQFEKMKNGEIEDSEIENSKLYMKSRFTSMKDSLRTMEDYYLSQAIMNNDGGIDELIERIDKVTKEEIVEAFKRIEPDVIYFLKGNISEGGGEQ